MKFLIFITLFLSTANASYQIPDGSITPPKMGFSSVPSMNLGLDSSVGASALTIALKQADGSTAPSTGKGSVYASFRSATAATGSLTRVARTSALSLVIPSTATMGQVANISSNLRIYLINDSGTIDICASGSSYADNTLITNPTQISTSADDEITIFCTGSHTGTFAVRYIGSCLNTQSTPGTWAADCTSLSVALNDEPTKGMYTGYHGIDCKWARTNTAFGDPTADATCTYTDGNDFYFPTVTSVLSGSDKLPGIQWTAVKAVYYRYCVHYSFQGATGVTAGAQVINQDSVVSGIISMEHTSGAIESYTTCGFSKGVVGTNSLKLQTKSASSSTTINVSDKYFTHWTVEEI